MTSVTTSSKNNNQQNQKKISSGIKETPNKVISIKLSPNSHFLSGIVLISIWFIVVIIANSGVHTEEAVTKQNQQHHLFNNEPPKGALHVRKRILRSEDSNSPKDEKKKEEKTDNNKKSINAGKSIKDFILSHLPGKNKKKVVSVEKSMAEVLASDTLTPADNEQTIELKRGSLLKSMNAQYHLKFEDDGNLVLYKVDVFDDPTADDKGRICLWHTNTKQSSSPDNMFVFQNDGNMVVKDPTGNVKWSSGVSFPKTSDTSLELTVKNDGNVVVNVHDTSDGQDIRKLFWQTGTNEESRQC